MRKGFRVGLILLLVMLVTGISRAAAADYGIGLDVDNNTVTVTSLDTFDTAVLIAAVYNSEGLTALKSAAVNICEGKNTFCCPIAGYAPGDTVKVMVWKSLADTTPLFPSCTADIEEKLYEYGVRFKVTEDDATDYFAPCERLGDAVGLTATAESPEKAGRSDFDLHYPWSDIKLCSLYRTSDGKMIKTYEGEDGFDRGSEFIFAEIPKFYIKRYIKDGYEYRYISNLPDNGYITDPSFVENGRELDYIYVSAYEGGDSGGRLVSGAGLFPMSEKSRGEFSYLAKKHGKGFGILDIRTLMTLQNLYLIEFAEKNSQKAIGNGWTMCLQPDISYTSLKEEASVNRIVIKNPGKSKTEKLFIGGTLLIISAQTNKIIHQRIITDIVTDNTENTLTVYFDGSPIRTGTGMYIGSGAQKTGSADSLSHHTGRTDGHGGEHQFLYRTGVRYRNMENLWGNVWHFIDGINIKKGKTVFCVNMSSYNVKSLGYLSCSISQRLQTSNASIGGSDEIHYLKSLGYDENYPWLALPCDYTYENHEELEGASAKLREGNFGDYYYLNDTATNYVHGGGFDHYWRSGLFTLRGWQDEKKEWYLYGTRLIYKPPI